MIEYYDKRTVKVRGDNVTVTYTLRGLLHRHNGPAMVDFATGSATFWIHGKQLSEECYNKIAYPWRVV
jgi:hypothetical protein